MHIDHEGVARAGVFGTGAVTGIYHLLEIWTNHGDGENVLWLAAAALIMWGSASWYRRY